MSAYDKFRDIFWDAFHRPDLKSEKFENTWKEIQPLNDLLAGPLFSIYENTQCDYIFNDKTRFPQMNHTDDFLNWSIEIINQYKDLISSESADNDIEKKDKQILLYQTDMMMELTNLAFEIISKDKFEPPL